MPDLSYTRGVRSAFDRAAQSLSRVLGIAFDESSQPGPLELVLDGSLVVELHTHAAGTYLVVVLSEDEELSFDAPIFHPLLDEADMGKATGCVVAYEEDRQRLIAWREVPISDALTDSALDLAVQEILRALEACSLKVSPLFSRALRAGGGQEFSLDFAGMG